MKLLARVFIISLVGHANGSGAESVRDGKAPESKVPPIHLEITVPPGEIPKDAEDLMTYVEGRQLKLKKGKKSPTDFDYYRLMGARKLLESKFTEDDMIDSKCDMVSLLARKIPEVALLEKKSNTGKISFTALIAAIALTHDESGTPFRYFRCCRLEKLPESKEVTNMNQG